MTMTPQAVARQCLDGAEQGGMTFPQILATLGEAGFEAYLVDYRRAASLYYRPDGDSVELPMRLDPAPVAVAFDAPGLRAAIRDAQTLAPGYSYRGFCDRARAAGCAGYIVSLLGRRVLYFGRTGETHVEHFPDPS